MVLSQEVLVPTVCQERMTNTLKTATRPLVPSDTGIPKGSSGRSGLGTLPRHPIGTEAHPYWGAQTFHRIFSWMFKWQYVASTQDKDKYVSWCRYWYHLWALPLWLASWGYPVARNLSSTAQHGPEGQAMWHTMCLHLLKAAGNGTWDPQWPRVLLEGSEKLRKAVAHHTGNTKSNLQLR